jgi:nickel superoxide dismutase
MLYEILDAIDRVKPFKRVKAHCDIPCGIYDPIFSQVAALTVIRMVDMIRDAEEKGRTDTVARCLANKEEHAEKCKHEVRVLFGDYFKPDHLEHYPELQNLNFSILKTASLCKQEIDRDKGMDLLKQVNRLAEIFWTTKNKKTKRVKAPYEPQEEIVIPEL